MGVVLFIATYAQRMCGERLCTYEFSMTTYSCYVRSPFLWKMETHAPLLAAVLAGMRGALGSKAKPRRSGPLRNSAACIPLERPTVPQRPHETKALVSAGHC